MRPPTGTPLRGHVVVVTGASAGVGRAVVREFAARGAHVAVLARGGAGLEAAVEDVRAAGGRSFAVRLDVAEAAAVDDAARQVEESLGPIEVWVNNANASVFAPAWEVTPAEFRRVTEVGYLGYVHGTLAALRRMMPRDRGVVVQVGSALAYRAIPLQAAYCAGKHAIVGFTDSLRCELAHVGSGVAVTSVHLPALNTPQFFWVRSRLRRRAQPVPPIFQPEVAARAVVHAAAHPRREYWVGGPTVATLLANRVVPGLLDRYLARTGFDSQQTDEPRLPDRADILDEPLDDQRDLGAHGGFGERAHPRSYQAWTSRHRRAAGLVAGSAGLLGLARAALRRL